MKEVSEKQKARDFVEKSAPACRGCKNFGSFSCPVFREAVEGGLDSKQLVWAIEEDQAGEDLNPCPEV